MGNAIKACSGIVLALTIIGSLVLSEGIRDETLASGFCWAMILISVLQFVVLFGFAQIVDDIAAIRRTITDNNAVTTNTEMNEKLPEL